MVNVKFVVKHAFFKLFFFPYLCKCKKDKTQTPKKIAVQTIDKWNYIETLFLAYLNTPNRKLPLSLSNSSATKIQPFFIQAKDEVIQLMARDFLISTSF